MSNIPNWAKKWKRPGTTMVMVKDICCLYTIKSKRVPGKTYPVVERKYIGTVREDGVHIKVDVNIDQGDVELYEAGLTDLLFSTITADDLLIEGKSEKEKLEKAERALIVVLAKHSPASYLFRDKELPSNIGVRTGVYETLIKRKLGISIEELEPLKDIKLMVFADGNTARSKMNEEQLGIYKKLGVSLPWQRPDIKK